MKTLTSIFILCIASFGTFAQEINLNNIARVTLPENAVRIETANVEAYLKSKILNEYMQENKSNVYEINGLTLIILPKYFTKKVDDLTKLKQAYDYMNGGKDPNSKLFTINNAQVVEKFVDRHTELDRYLIYSINKENLKQTCSFTIAFPKGRREEATTLCDKLLKSLHFIGD